MRVLQSLEVPDSVSRYTGSGPAKSLIMVVVLGLVYCLPTMLAWKRQSGRRWKITAINLLLGWTIIGWFVAMVMTYAFEPPAAGEEPDREYEPGSRRD